MHTHIEYTLTMCVCFLFLFKLYFLIFIYFLFPYTLLVPPVRRQTTKCSILHFITLCNYSSDNEHDRYLIKICRNCRQREMRMISPNHNFLFKFSHFLQTNLRASFLPLPLSFFFCHCSIIFSPLL